MPLAVLYPKAAGFIDLLRFVPPVTVYLGAAVYGLYYCGILTSSICSKGFSSYPPPTLALH